MYVINYEALGTAAYSYNVALAKEWSVISLGKFNRVALNMHRQGPNGKQASSITKEQPTISICI